VEFSGVMFHPGIEVLPQLLELQVQPFQRNRTLSPWCGP